MGYVATALVVGAGIVGIYLALRDRSGGGGGVSPTGETSILPKVGTLFVIGDSLAVGMRKRFEMLADADGVRLDYRAKGGTMTREWLNRFPDLEAGDVLVCVLGTNDAAGSGRHFHDAMVSILDRAESLGVPVVWAEPTGRHFPGYTRVMLELERALLDEELFALVPAPLEGYASDRYHLTPAGYSAWADKIWSTLQGEERPHV